MLQKVTSYSSTGGGTSNIVDEVLYEYNKWGQLTKEQQSHSGPVVTGTPAVQYDYADGSQNTIRLTTMPASRLIPTRCAVPSRDSSRNH